MKRAWSPARFIEIADSDYDYLADLKETYNLFRLRSVGMENVLELTHLKNITAKPGLWRM